MCQHENDMSAVNVWMPCVPTRQGEPKPPAAMRAMKAKEEKKMKKTKGRGKGTHLLIVIRMIGNVAFGPWGSRSEPSGRKAPATSRASNVLEIAQSTNIEIRQTTSTNTCTE